ncbi:hypothetical protein GQ457_02G040410 [Hibiscus cannabinus]
MEEHSTIKTSVGRIREFTPTTIAVKRLNWINGNQRMRVDNMKGLNPVSSSVTRKQSAIKVKAVKYTRRTLIHKSPNLEPTATAAISISRSWKKKKRVVAVSRVMNLRGRLRAFLMEVKPALPAAVA